MSYIDLGFNSFGIKTIVDSTRQTPQETRNLTQPGAVTADALYIGTKDEVVKADEDGLYAGDSEFDDAPFSVDTDGILKIPYRNAIHTSPENGDIWIESDGLHIYAGGQEIVISEDYLKVDASNDPVTGALALSSTLDVTGATTVTSLTASSSSDLTDTTIGDGTNDVDVDSTGNLIFTGGAGLAFAEIYVKDSSATISLDADLADVKITQFTTNGQSNNCTADADNDKITFTKTGKYLVTVSLGVSIDAGSTTQLDVHGYLNGVVLPNMHMSRSLATGAPVGSMTMSGIIDVTTADWDLDLRANVTDTTARNVTFSDLNLSAVLIGGT